MNFAQLIDPEWVQAGCPVRHPRRQPAPVAPLGTVNHSTPEDDTRSVVMAAVGGRRTGGVRKMLEILASATKPLTCREIAEKDPALDRQTVSTRMFALVTGGRVTRSGPIMGYRHVITGKGRASL